MTRIKKIIEKAKAKKINIDIISVILIVTLIVMASIKGINRAAYSNFYPINGDFQNYNPVRRFLAGQIPYKDFSIYLGSGHMLLLSFILMLIGNNFTKSLFASNFLTFFIFEFLAYVISFLILKDKKKALYSTVVISLINFIKPKFLCLIDGAFVNALWFGTVPGVSARLIRFSILPIVISIIYLGNRWLENNKKITKYKDIVKKIMLAVVAGISIAWSNDGGIAVYIATSFVYFLLLIKQYKKKISYIIKYTFLYIFISLVSLCMAIAIITRGNIISWFSFNLGVSSYQKWYYGGVENANITLANLDLSIYVVIMAIIVLYFIYKLFKSNKKSEIINYALLVILVLTPLISSFIYQWMSGNYSKEMLHLVLLIISFVYIEKILLIKFDDNKVRLLIKRIIIFISCAILISSSWTQLLEYKNRDGIYIKELGGCFTKLGGSIQEAVNKIGNEKIFSVYASAIEVATNQYQPTGDDYIIHCLGDERREKYIKEFKKENFKYVVTMDNDYTEWRTWIRNANWFLYREIYKDYVPVFGTEYNVFFEKSNEDNIVKFEKENNVNVKIEKQNEQVTKLIIETKDKEFNGIADVKISYNSAFKESIFKKLTFNRFINVNDITSEKIISSKSRGASYNIPNESEGYYIPITIINGIGEVEISSYPENNSILNINNVDLINVYDVIFKYCIVDEKNGIQDNKLYIKNTSENKVILNGVKSIKINNIETVVTNYEEKDEHIVLKVENNAEAFAYPYYFEVIK